MLGTHHVIGAAVGLAGDHRDLGHSGLGVGVDQLGTTPDDAVPFLVRAGQKAGHVDEGEYRDVEGVTGPDEPGGLLGGVDVQAACQLGGLVGHDPDAAAFDTPVANDDIGREKLVHFQKFSLVDDADDHLMDVVGRLGRVRDQRVQFPV